MKRMLSVCLALMLLITVVPAVSSAATYGYVTGGWLRMRSGPSFDNSTVASYYTGTMVEILGTSGSWYNVKAPDGKTGYMYSSYISSSGGGGGTGTAYVTSSNGYGVRLRSGPSTGYRILGVFSVGTAMTVLESGTNWSKVQIGSTVGFMMNQFLTTSGGGTSGETAVVWSPNGLGVRLRSGPGTGYGIIGVYSVGTTVTILSHGSTWDQIRVGSRTGYMMNYYLTSAATPVATGIVVTPATTTAAPGGSVAIVTTVSGSNLSNPSYTLAITQNDSMATLSGNTLTVKNTATVGSVIIVTATTADNGSSGSKLTATCSITVTAGTPTATSVTIAPSTASVKQGSSVTFTVTVNGVNLSNPAYTLSITANDSMATLSGNTLTVKSSATVGSVIKVTALSADNNSSGNKIAATSDITVAATTAPGAPTLSTANAGNASVALTWAAPTDNGGSAVVGYVVYRSTTNNIADATSTSLLGGSLTGTTVTSLTNGTAYYFWVAAVNSVGTGSASASLSATPSATILVPGAPTLNTATAGNAQVALAWTAPTDTGSGALTGYNVYRSTTNTFPGTGGIAVFGASTTNYTFTGLTNGTTYYFWVTATNGAGEGAASASLSATPATVPSAPTLDSATAGNGQVSLSWTAASNNGGSTLTGFKVYHGTTGNIADATSETVLDGSATSHTVTGLTNGTQYYFWVSAVNGVGESEKSGNKSATPVTVPSAPTLDSATAGAGQVALCWTAASGTGGSALTGFKVYRSTTSNIADATSESVSGGSTASYTATGLTNGTTYYFWVSAVNGVGESDKSGSKSATPATVPDAPGSFAAGTVSGTTVPLSWAAAASNGSTISGYVIEYGTDTSYSAGSQTAGAGDTGISIDVGGTGTWYFRIHATSNLGSGASATTTANVT